MSRDEDKADVSIHKHIQDHQEEGEIRVRHRPRRSVEKKREVPALELRLAPSVLLGLGTWSVPVVVERVPEYPGACDGASVDLAVERVVSKHRIGSDSCRVISAV